MGNDLRYTMRTLRRDAGFAVIAILILGVGIGSNTAIFSVLNTLLIRSLPFRDSGRLVWIANTFKGEGLSGSTSRVSNFNDLRKTSKSFEDMASYFAFFGDGDDTLTGRGEPERLGGVGVSQNFFQVLGVQPKLGRLFDDEESKWHGRPAVLLSENLWERRFASDPKIVGQTILLNDKPVTVIGVIPREFDFASIFSPSSRIDLYEPFPLTQETDRWGNTLSIVGRLKPGVTIESAQAEINVIVESLHREHPERGKDWGARLTALQDQVSGRLRRALVVLGVAVGVVMLIVCANLSNLLLARAAARRKEIAVRTALGAGRWRLIRQMLTESLVLSLCGAVLGLVLAFIATRAFAAMPNLSIPLMRYISVDRTALLFTLLAAILTGLIFGIVPALQQSKGDLNESLKDSNRGSSEGKGKGWIRSVLVVSEVAMACVLLVGAGLLIRSFLRVMDVDLGFQPERAATMRVDPGPNYKTHDQRNGYFTEVLRRAQEVPGVNAVGLTDALPLGKNRTWCVGARGQTYPPGQYPCEFIRIVSEGYIRAMGVPMRAGREFEERDGTSGVKVAMVNETMARKLWPGQDAVGQILLNPDPIQVVGVVADVRHLAVEKEAGMELYLDMRQGNDYSSVDLVVRTKSDPQTLAGAVRAALIPVNPSLPANEFRPLEMLVNKAVSPRRFIVLLLGGFAAIALILASLGIYGVISYSVSQRTQEIGIRMALGASSSHVRLRVLRQAMALALTGVVVGAVGAWVTGRLLGSLLYGVSAGDPLTFGAMVALLTMVAMAAAYFPARRASMVDPMTALRN
ncbi:MAG TPA: ABC transporter permease [Bryobacteraceae bacterium]|jgi:predicted permease|nr:ABC transporter permease [Bryobacteraceae bacterium]